MVGMFILLVISLDNFFSVHSNTIENTPAFSNKIASLSILILSFNFFPFKTNFFSVLSKKPKLPNTGILFFIRVLIVGIILFPPSSLTASHFVLLIIILAFFNAILGFRQVFYGISTTKIAFLVPNLTLDA